MENYEVNILKRNGDWKKVNPNDFLLDTTKKDIKNNIKSKGVLNISKFYLIDFSKIKICRPAGTHIGAQRHRRNVACTELLLSQYLLKSHVKIILNIIRTSKTQIASLSGHLPSYLFIFFVNF